MWLLDRVSAFMHQTSVAGELEGVADIELQAATAILLLEAAYGDAEYDWSEHRVIMKGLERAFGIGRREVLALLGRAEEIRPPIVKLADVTSVIAARFDVRQRRAVMGLVWEVIDADDVLLEWEESFAEHVATALGLTPEEGRAARSRIPGRSRAGLSH